jgi:hypothetical protein
MQITACPRIYVPFQLLKGAPGARSAHLQRQKADPRVRYDLYQTETPGLTTLIGVPAAYATI